MPSEMRDSLKQFQLLQHREDLVRLLVRPVFDEKRDGAERGDLHRQHRLGERDQSCLKLGIFLKCGQLRPIAIKAHLSLTAHPPGP